MHNNLVVVGDRGHAITITEPQMHLDEGRFSENNAIHDNVIVFSTACGTAGFWHDYGSGNLYDNFYSVAVSDSVKFRNFS